MTSLLPRIPKIRFFSTAARLHYQPATAAHKDQIIDFLLNFFRLEESISRSVQLGRDESKVLFEYLVDDALRAPVSFVVVDQDQLVAVRLSSIVDLAQARRCIDVPVTAEESAGLTEKAQIIVRFLDRLNLGLPEVPPLSDSQKALKMMVISVRPDHFKQGIAQRSIRLSFAQGLALGCSVAYTEATALRSQQLYRDKLNFSPIKVVQHDDFCDENGRRLLNCDDGTDCGIVYAKKLTGADCLEK